jgi:hypothetical protein
MQITKTPYRFTGAIALMALITVTVMAALEPAHRNAAAEAYGADYLHLNPELD